MSRILIIRFLTQTHSDYLTTWFQVAWTIKPCSNYPINSYTDILIIPNLSLSIHCNPMLRYLDTPTLRFVRLRIRTTRLQWPKYKRLRVSSRIDPPSRGGRVRHCGHKRHTLQSKVDTPFPARATVLHRYIPAVVGCVFHSFRERKLRFRFPMVFGLSDRGLLYSVHQIIIDPGLINRSTEWLRYQWTDASQYLGIIVSQYCSIDVSGYYSIGLLGYSVCGTHKPELYRPEYLSSQSSSSSSSRRFLVARIFCMSERAYRERLPIFAGTR